MTQLEFYKSFQFMAELLAAETLFLVSLRRRNFFILRLVLSLAACFLFSFLFPIVSDNSYYMSLMFVSLFVFTVCMNKVIFKESWVKLFFCCVAGYTVQHLAYQLNNIVTVAMTGGRGAVLTGMYGDSFAPMFSNPLFAILYFFIYISVYFCCYYAFARRLRTQKFNLPSVFGFVLVSAILIVDVVLNAVAIHVIETPAGIIVSGIYNVVCCLLGLFLQFEVLLRWGLYSQLRMNRIVRRYERERYAAVREAMETINIKCHDLKHQIHRFRSENMLSEAAAADMENAISEYAAFRFTGNSALDMVLSETNRVCLRNDVRASYMADGKLISFMSDEDVYSLFSNLLDNAVESVIQCPVENRTMGLRIEKSCGNLISVGVYNYCGSTDFVFSDGLPRTTKKHDDVHGFGLKSVRRICEKYGGTLDICPEDGFFNVNILFPNISAA